MRLTFQPTIWRLLYSKYHFCFPGFQSEYSLILFLWLHWPINERSKKIFCFLSRKPQRLLLIFYNGLMINEELPHGDGSILLLAGCVPDLGFDSPWSVNSDGLRVVLNSDSGNGDIWFLFVVVGLDDISFTSSAISNNNDFVFTIAYFCTHRSSLRNQFPCFPVCKSCRIWTLAVRFVILILKDRY